MSHCGCVGKKEVGDKEEKEEKRDHTFLGWKRRKDSGNLLGVVVCQLSLKDGQIFQNQNGKEEYSGQKTQDRIRYQKS